MENKSGRDYGQKGGNPQEKRMNTRADKDEIYESADQQAKNANSNRFENDGNSGMTNSDSTQDRDAGNANLSTDSGGGLTLPEDRVEANLEDSRSGGVNDQNADWDKQQNMRGAGRIDEDTYPEF